MKFDEMKNICLEEIKKKLNEIDGKKIELFIRDILKADKIFVMGVGRVMFMSQCFTKRLPHLGLCAYVVGETTMPAITRKDLLIASSGSGETLTTLNVARLAKKHNARVDIITANTQSSLSKISDLVIKIPCSTKFKKNKKESIQPLTNLFEQSLLIFFDCVAIMLMKKLHVKEKEMWRRHANLE